MVYGPKIALSTDNNAGKKRTESKSKVASRDDPWLHLSLSVWVVSENTSKY